MAAILYRYEKVRNGVTGTGTGTVQLIFTDAASISGWAYESVC